METLGDKLINELKQKAYAQGYHTGLNALPWKAADWELEFVPEYRRGHNDGIADRQREMNAPTAAEALGQFGAIEGE